MPRLIATLIDRHALLWSNDRLYRGAWLIWPQGLSLVVIGTIWINTASPDMPSMAPWAKPLGSPSAAPTGQQSPPIQNTTSTAQNKRLDNEIVGKVFNKTVPAGGFIIPLPDGNWTGLAADAITAINGQSVTGMQYFLSRIEGGRLIGAVQVFAAETKERPGNGFKKFQECENISNNNIFTENEGCTGFESQSYWRIFNYYSPFQYWSDRTLNIPDLDRRAGHELSEQKISYPQDFVGVELNRAEKWGWLKVVYLFSPEEAGIPPKPAPNFRASDWHSSNITRFPEKMAYAHKLQLWGKALWPNFKAAFAAAE